MQSHYHGCSTISHGFLYFSEPLERKACPKALFALLENSRGSECNREFSHVHTETVQGLLFHSDTFQWEKYSQSRICFLSNCQINNLNKFSNESPGSPGSINPRSQCLSFNKDHFGRSLAFPIKNPLLHVYTPRHAYTEQRELPSRLFSGICNNNSS